MTYETIFAGFGGQGILFAGKIIAYAGMIENKNNFLIFYPKMPNIQLNLFRQ